MSAAAWVLSLDDGQRVAVGEAELVHLLGDAPREFPVPLLDGPGASLVLWEGRPTPVADLTGAARGGLIAVVAYDAGGSQEAAHGAIRVASVPARREVEDAQAAGADEVPPRLRPHVHAAFRDAEGVVPILDLQALFGPPAPRDA